MAPSDGGPGALAHARRPIPVASVTPTTATDPTAPTPHERARRAFTAHFLGTSQTGPGRLVGQVSQTLIAGAGTSTAFLRGNLRRTYSIPADPSAPITGKAALYDLNNPNSGSVLMVDLVADRSDLDVRGLPTRMTWTVGDGSGGTFTDANGQGTVEIHYRTAGKNSPRVFLSGRAAVVFRGQLNVLGITNPLRFLN